MRATAASLALAALLVAGEGAAQPLPVTTSDAALLARRAGAWDRSVALEQQGQLAAARQLLLEAWGPASASYEVTVRVAWLSLQLGDYPSAVEGYRRALGLSGAAALGSDWDAKPGLVSALTGAGFDALETRDRPTARDQFREALALDPAREDARRGLRLAAAHRLAVELWGAYVGLTGTTSTRGGAGFVAVRSELSDHLRLGVAFRHLELSTHDQVTLTVDGNPGPGPGVGAQRDVVLGFDTPWRQEELYGSLGFVSHWVAVEGMGLVLFRDVNGQRDRIFGEAAGLRLGWSWGLTVDQALLFRPEGERFQLRPMAFAWPHRIVGLAAGAHVTVDPDGTSVSGRLGLSLQFRPVSVDLQGFVGPERYPVDRSAPGVGSLVATLTGGGAAVLWFHPTPSWSLGLAGSLARTALDDVVGTHHTLGAGVRWSPALFSEPTPAPCYDFP